jgi:nucleoside-diphosphate-sugar epimerase
MANPILVTGAAGRVGAIGRTVTELLLKQGKAVRAMVRSEDERAQALRLQDFVRKNAAAFTASPKEA